MEITEAEQNKEKQIKRNEDSLRNLWNNIKCSNIHIIGVSEGKEREKEAKNLSEDIIAENFPNLGKETNIQAEDSQRIPNKLDPKRTTPRHIVIKMEKLKIKGILEVAREKPLVTYKETPIRLLGEFSATIL